MKYIKHMLLFFLLVILTLNLNGGFWIKAIWGGQGQLIYDEKSGNFFSFDWFFSIFDITGKVHFWGGFSIHPQVLVLEKTIRLDDETFSSIGRMVKWPENTTSGSFHIIRFNQDRVILFSKEIKKDEDFGLVDLLQLDDKIKVIGRYEDENNKKYIVILTFSENGDLLKSKILHGEGNHYNLEFWDSNCVKIDAVHYGIIINGNFEENNNWYNGVLFIELNKEDEIKKSKFYFDIKQDCWYFNQIIKKDSDAGFSILLEGDYYNETDINNRYRLFFLKLDSDWNMKWSKEYNMGLEYDWIYPVDFFEDQGGFTVGINSTLKINGEDKEKPILLKINQNGSPAWCKKYSAEDSYSEGLMGITGVPNVGIVMSNNAISGENWVGAHIYLLNQDGDVPGGCSIPEKVTVEDNTKIFYKGTIIKDSLKFSDFNLSVEDGRAGLWTESSGGTIESFCEYQTMWGKVTIIIERSMLGGYYINKINFSADPMITPYITKFKIYRKFEADDEYVFVLEVVKEEGKTDYEVEVKPVYSKSYTYKIVAVNSDDEVVDIGIPY